MNKEACKDPLFHISNCFTHLGSFRCPCLAWYFIPLTFLYLFLQPGTGQANGLSTSPSLEFCIILQIYNKTCHEQFARNKPKTCSKSKFLWKLIIDRHLPFDIVMYYNSYFSYMEGWKQKVSIKVPVLFNSGIISHPPSICTFCKARFIL